MITQLLLLACMLTAILGLAGLTAVSWSRAAAVRLAYAARRPVQRRSATAYDRLVEGWKIALTPTVVAQTVNLRGGR